MSPHELLEGHGLDREDVDTVASEIADKVQAQRPEFSLELRWAIEGAIKGAFGFEDDDEDEEGSE